MGAEHLRVCVTSGYRIVLEGTSGGGYEAEAIVYAPGGLTRVRFTLGASGRSHADIRGIVRAKAEAWIAADDVLRREMVRRDAQSGSGDKSKWWRAHGVPV